VTKAKDNISPPTIACILFGAITTYSGPKAKNAGINHVGIIVIVFSSHRFVNDLLPILPVSQHILRQSGRLVNW